MMRTLYLPVVVAGALMLGGCGYNTLQAEDEQIKAAWGEVLNQYQRRADLIPNLVRTVEAFARASVTPISTACSCAAKPFTVLTRFGIRSARRWYWLTTSDQADFTCSSCTCRVL